MYIPLKWSTVSFLLQIVVGGITFGITHNVPTTLNAAFLAAVLLAFIIALEWAGTGKDPVGTDFYGSGIFLSIAAACAVWIAAPFFGQQHGQMSQGTAIFMVIAFVAVSARDYGRAVAPFVLRFLFGLPLGIGTAIGGIVLLYRGWDRFRELAGWI